jgi:dTMP kinase
MKGKLIIFEGSDGTGKSTLCSNLVTHLQSAGKEVLPLSFPGRSEGTLGKIVYEIHHDAAAFGIETIDPTALQCLHIAAHLDAITTRILPAVAQGSLVLLDRYWWSTFVYGVVGGGNRHVISKLIDAEVLAWDWLTPSAVFLVDREAPLRDEPLQHWTEWRSEYLALAAREQTHHPVHVIANNSSADDALERILELLEPA